MSQRKQIRFLLAILVALWLTPATAAQTKTDAVGAISMTVSDLDRSVAFYSRVLRFEKTAEKRDSHAGSRIEARVAEMKLGDERIQLMQFPSGHSRPIPADSHSNDHWFQHIAIIVSDIDRAYAILQANHVRGASVAPQRLPDWNKNAAGIRAYYFLDPDAHPLEILQFPPDKGTAKWHRKGRLFLGIDHTAIVVTDTEASLRFYRDLLGLMIAGTSENYGPEQERLSNVPGAHLRITTLRAASGPGIELLEYLAPRTGRDLPFDPKLADLVHRHTTLFVADLDAVGRAITKASPRTAIDLRYATSAGQPNAFFVRDPDGHELLVRAQHTLRRKP